MRLASLGRIGQSYLTMPFPETQRVLYSKNPLDKVVCQLRFPPILRIAAELPAAFQERIRDTYPLFERKPVGGRIVPNNAAAQLGFKIELGPGDEAYSFSSEDGAWEICLAKDFISLTTLNYQRWEEFSAQLTLPLLALADLYAPPFFSRIGLRYQDVIVRSDLGLGETPWGELLQPHIAAELAEPLLAGHIAGFHRKLDLVLPERDGQVRIQQSLVQNTDSGEVCYLIDSDFYTHERTEVSDARATLNYFNQLSGRLFQWCITPRLHDAMGPQEQPTA